MAKSKKILYLVTQSEWGGAQKYIYDLATNLPASSMQARQAGLPDFEVIVGAGEGNGELLKRLHHHNIKTLKLKFCKRAVNPFFDLLALFEIIAIYLKYKPDVIHLNSSKISILGSLAAKLINQKSTIIYTVHGWVFNEPLPSWKKNLYLYLERVTARLKNKIICVSEYDKDIALNNYLCFEEKFITIHNGLDYNNLHFLNKIEARQKLQVLNPRSSILSPQSSVIGTIANLYKTKGLEYLIDSAREVIANHPHTIFMVIGEGPERINLTSQIKELGLENNFLLPGNIDQAYRYLKAFNIFVLPSVKEGLPYTLLEALAAQLPVIAAKVGGVPEIIEDEVNGLLIEPRDIKQLTNAINRLITDNNLQQQLISNINLEKFSMQQMVDKTRKLY